MVCPTVVQLSPNETFLFVEAFCVSVHEIFRSIWVPYPLEEVFIFFSEARNLERLTGALPVALGPLGEIVHRLQVKQDVERIFDYRTTQIRQIFAGFQSQRRSSNVHS